MKITGLFAITLTLWCLMACQSLNPENTQITYTVSASLVHPSSKAAFQQQELSFNLLTKWQGFEHINLFFLNGTGYHELEAPVKISEVSDDGFSGAFHYSLPDKYEQTDIRHIYCFTTTCRPALEDNKLYCNASLIRDPIDKFVVPVYGKGDGAGNISIKFKHYYAYELLHLRNVSPEEISFSLSGYEVPKIWYNTKGSLCITDGTFMVNAPSTQQPVMESSEATVPKGEDVVIVSAYVPNGLLIENAVMVARINGVSVHSVNSKSSSVTLHQGHAYHLYACWDGQQLFFEDGTGHDEDLNGSGSGYGDNEGSIGGNGSGYNDNNGGYVGGVGSGYDEDGGEVN